jgi:hypothetical protein
VPNRNQVDGVARGAAHRSHPQAVRGTTCPQAEVSAREAAIRDQQAQIAAAKDSLEAQVAARVDEERGRIAAAEAQKAKRLVAIDVDAKVKQIADLNDVLRQRDAGSTLNQLTEPCQGRERSKNL